MIPTAPHTLVTIEASRRRRTLHLSSCIKAKPTRPDAVIREVAEFDEVLALMLTRGISHCRCVVTYRENKDTQWNDGLRMANDAVMRNADTETLLRHLDLAIVQFKHGGGADDGQAIGKIVGIGALLRDRVVYDRKHAEPIGG